MKLLLDEKLSPRLAQLLCDRGFDVTAVADTSGLVEASDREVMDAAGLQDRAVVTANVKDFRPIASERISEGRGHAGLVLPPGNRSLSRDSIGALAEAIEDVLRSHPAGLADREFWITPL